MRLADDWPSIVKRAWSIRLILLAGILSGAEVAMPYLPIAVASPGLFAVASLIVTAAAFVARIVAQNDLGEGT